MRFRILILLLLLFSFCFGKDTYKNISELRQNEKEGEDYIISSVQTDSSVAVIAIHGGKIEKGSSEVAKLLATKGNYNYYSFEGIKKGSNAVLHITSTNFDEKLAKEIVGKSQKTISVHGMAGGDLTTNLGGLDLELIELIEKHLVEAGFKVAKAPKELGAKNPKNIANCNLSKKGVQLELTKGLRDSFLKGEKSQEQLNKYVEAIHKSLIASNKD